MHALSLDTSPHVYYTVKELSVVKDVTMLKNASVKTIGYFKGDRLYGTNLDPPKGSTDAADSIALDLTHQDIDFASNKPYLLVGLLFTVNYTPVLVVKAARQLDTGLDGLTTYHNQLMTIRKRTKHFQDLMDAAKKNYWI